MCTKSEEDIDQSLEIRRRATLRIARNLLQINSVKRPEPETPKELFLYYFDFLFGELCFWQGWIPVVKLGAIPHCLLVLGISLAKRNEDKLLLHFLLLYLICVILIVVMTILMVHIRHYFSSK
ncbi:hypothetical protein [Streptococcus pluranimalium]|uniref:Uncharacterized protein n=1 Tax=Streptococcus pluranimalium TaxID=82348 RepID=A0A345VJB0_9STRE|nr:hypothetical protein [Streptococcus pluranimalium]AXJ12812.1 hypothetical protein Sp14A_08910 [Streptococcus pluranimalium]